MTVGERPVRIGAIGAGWWATTNHFPVLRKRPDVELVSVCGLGAQLLAEIAGTFGFAHATEDYRELLEQDLDAVVVASPHHLHFEHASAALRRGLHVLVEKPMTLRAAEAWELVRMARERGVHVLVPLGWHYQDFIVRAKELMDTGVVGDIEYVLCHMASPTIGLFAGTGEPPPTSAPTILSPDPRTWQSPTGGGGYAHGQISHSSSLLFWLTGLRASKVSALMTGPGAAVDLYDAAHVVFDNGAVGTISGAATLPDGEKFQVDVRVFGRDGVLLLDVERERAVVRRRDGRHHEIPVEPGAGAYRCERPPDRFVDLVSGASTQNNSGPEVVARSVELIDAMHRSAALGGTQVSIDS